MTTPIQSTTPQTPFEFSFETSILRQDQHSQKPAGFDPERSKTLLKQLENRRYDRPIILEIQKKETPELRGPNANLHDFEIEIFKNKSTQKILQTNLPSSEITATLPLENEGIFDRLQSLFDDLIDFVQKPIVSKESIQAFLSKGLWSLDLDENPIARGIVESWSETISSLSSPQNLLIASALIAFPALVPAATAIGTVVGAKQVFDSSREAFAALKKGNTEASAKLFSDALTGGLLMAGSLKTGLSSKIAGMLDAEGSLGRVSIAASAEKTAVRMTGEAVQIGRKEARLRPSIELKFDRQSKTWISPAGLRFGEDSVFRNRIKHVLSHLSPPKDQTKKTHTIFSAARKELISLLDEAWSKRGKPIPSRSFPNREFYIIDMERYVGTMREKHIQIVVNKNTAEIVSAYLWRPRGTL